MNLYFTGQIVLKRGCATVYVSKIGLFGFPAWFYHESDKMITIR